VWLLALFAASIGLPFFAVSANGTLLQAWFSRTGHLSARDPYFLYGASNLGSFIALLAYPVAFEPLFTLGEQARLWTAGYLALIIAMLGCGGLAVARSRSIDAVAADDPIEVAPTSWRRRGEWVLWAFLPSALLVAVTAHLSTNIAAAPFLWVAPLALYLFSFVLTFQRQRLLPHRTVQLMLPFAAAALLTAFEPALFGILGGIAVNLFGFFVIAMAWHGELVARRPNTRGLTEFYLFMSLGGVLGGAFTTLAAPVLFNTVVEFPILLAAGLLALPETRSSRWRLAASSAAVLAVAGLAGADLSGRVEYRERSFFGVTTTVLSEDGVFRILSHGTTVHGGERLSDLAPVRPGRPEPLTYYQAEGPLAEGLRIGRARAPGGSLSVGIVGLGTGSLACYAAPGDVWRFYEIDPAVLRVARDARRFNFLAECAPDAPLVQGDARLTLARERPASFDLLVIDAFSSDAIPVHLLTGEALRLYMEKLRPGGVALLHISNRYMELAGVVAATAAANGIAAARRADVRSEADLVERLWMSSDVVALSRDPASLEPYRRAAWKRLLPTKGIAPWTDDYANVGAAILRKQGLL
jgi:SAM-dependent methyltransferase